LWVQNFHEMGSCLKNNPPGDTTTARTPDDVRVAVLRSQQQPARKHATSLRTSELMLHLTLHQDLNGHPFKTMAVPASNICDTSNNKYSS
jgi:hypothetical protein